MKRLSINKTWKMYIGGAFVRSESGRVYPVHEAAGKLSSNNGRHGPFLANTSSATGKDVRNAVEAAEKAFAGWSGRSPFNRGQILYRFGEMMESRVDELTEILRRSTGASASAARREVTASIDRVVYYAGWADKYASVLGSTNPVASPYFNFTVPEPIGVIGVIAGDNAPLLGLLSQIIPAIVSGNTVVALASERYPGPATLLGEILAVSDVPGGGVNLLTGRRGELIETFATHEQIRGLDFVLSPDEATVVERGAATSIKRCKWRQVEESFAGDQAESVYEIRSFIEFKTTWHPHWV